jgi:hypothetical protein
VITLVALWKLPVLIVLGAVAALFIWTTLPYRLIMLVFKRIKKASLVGMVHPFKQIVMWYPKNTMPSERIKKHEQQHIVQVRIYGAWCFVLRYLCFNIWYGYDNNPLEVEARKVVDEG